MKAIGVLAAGVVRDAGSKRFGLKDPGIETPGQVFLATKQNELAGESGRSHVSRIADPVKEGSKALLDQSSSVRIRHKD